MRLLVSVAGAREARAALTGGADVIDVKDPGHGTLGAVRPEALRAVRHAVPPDHPLSVVLGDGARPELLVRRAAAAHRVGAAFVKVGFRGVRTPVRAQRLVAAARGGAGPATGVVVVAYADWRRAESLEPATLVGVAAAEGAAGVLLDTAVKVAGLFAQVDPGVVGEWITAAHAAGLFAGLAGGLRGTDFARARDLGADLVGVRGAACDGLRTGPISALRVAELSALARAAPLPAPIALV
jgi:(5-formylfuran-3-yl)methyl phosphate synthase